MRIALCLMPIALVVGYTGYVVGRFPHFPPMPPNLRE